MKFHRHKFWFPEKCVTFLMSSTSIFPSKMTVITNFFIFLCKIFLANPTFFCIVRVDCIILCHFHWFNFRKPNFFNFLPKSFTKYISHVFILWLFCIQNRFQFFPVTDNMKAESRGFMLLILFCIWVFWIWLATLNWFGHALKVCINCNGNFHRMLVVFKLES